MGRIHLCGFRQWGIDGLCDPYYTSSSNPSSTFNIGGCMCWSNITGVFHIYLFIYNYCLKRVLTMGKFTDWTLNQTLTNKCSRCWSQYETHYRYDVLGWSMTCTSHPSILIPFIQGFQWIFMFHSYHGLILVSNYFSPLSPSSLLSLRI